LPSLFADRVVTLKEGETAGPIRSPSGFHLIQLLETRGGSKHLVEQTRARHLLLTPNALRDEEATQALILQMRQRIQEGESLATLASEYSDDRASRQSGGDLGWVSPGQMVPAFEKAMQELEPGEVSQPVQSRFGWHLIEVEERRQADVTDSTRRQQVQQLLSERRFEEEVQNWLREIRDSTWVEIRG
jgi:peptidyl-prolyl cis-trans isomerase SurA